MLLIIKQGVGNGMLTGVCRMDTAGLAGGAPGTVNPNNRRKIYDAMVLSQTTCSDYQNIILTS